MSKLKNMQLVRVNVNMPITLVERVKEYANKLGINVTTAYIVLLNQVLTELEVVSESKGA